MLNISSLPLILAGPILRRVERGIINSGSVVEPSKVSVWVALKESRTNIELRVYDISGNLVMYGYMDTIELGTNLHVAVITAQSVINSSDYLSPDKNYFYDLIFGPGETLNSSSVSGSADFSLIDMPVPGVGYALPSFALPPSDLSDLRVLHGSCRKPHGGDTPGRFDVLPEFNTLMNTALDFSINAATDINNVFSLNIFNNVMSRKRPHQLFLTGDQIYADDVSATLLYMLKNAGDDLLAWTEALPGSPAVNDLLPGKRKQLVADAGFSAGDVAGSHLIRLLEFYSMYLFVWSDVVWPSAFPSFADVYPGEDYSKIRYIPIINIFQEKKTELGELYDKEKKSLENFKSNLSKVRRALANIPTYMIFDDHEITDDWYINQEWLDNVFGAVSGNNLGTRIIQNGLIAYTVFQGWGNNPLAFGLTPTDLLPSIETWRGAEDADSQRIRAYLGLPSPNTSLTKIDFYYYVNFDQYQVIVLDTRTERDFYTSSAKKSWFPGLLTDTAMTNQIDFQAGQKMPGTKFTLLVSPAPVIGHPFMEDVVQPIYAGYYVISNLLDRSDKSGVEEADAEAWLFRRATFEKLLDKLSQLEKVIILSGDVHYAFTASVEYWNQRTSPEKQAVFVQMTASSIKNEDKKTRGLSKNIVSRLTLGSVIDPSDTEDSFLGWSSGSGTPVYKKDGKNKSVKGSPPVLKMNDDFDGLVTPTNWQYKIKFLRDDRTEEERGTYALIATNIPVPPGTFPAWIEIYAHRGRDLYDNMRTVVGHNNFGEINIDGPDGNGDLWVIQQLWFSHTGNLSQLTPYTSVYARLEPPLSIDKPAI